MDHLLQRFMIVRSAVRSAPSPTSKPTPSCQKKLCEDK